MNRRVCSNKEEAASIFQLYLLDVCKIDIEEKRRICYLQILANDRCFKKVIDRLAFCLSIYSHYCKVQLQLPLHRNPYGPNGKFLPSLKNLISNIMLLCAKLNYLRSNPLPHLKHLSHGHLWFLSQFLANREPIESQSWSLVRGAHTRSLKFIQAGRSGLCNSRGLARLRDTPFKKNVSIQFPTVG